MAEFILSSLRASQILRPLFDPYVEEVWAMALASSKELLKTEKIFRGTSDACLFHPRDVFRFAIVNHASGFIVAHNHPFSSPLPSPEDIDVTKDLKDVSRVLGIALIDHIIIGKAGYFSFLDRKLLEPSAAGRLDDLHV